VEPIGFLPPFRPRARAAASPALDRFGKRGRISARDLQEQMNTCSCLTLILACIIYWQAREIERVVSECCPEAEKIDISLLEHVSPIEWDNVLLYGQYVIDRSLIRIA
jgi:hypothetical protein